jgi:hypothetical protein
VIIARLLYFAQFSFNAAFLTMVIYRYFYTRHPNTAINSSINNIRRKKKVTGFSEKFFNTWKKLPYLPQPVLPEVWRFLGVYIPPYPSPPTPMSGRMEGTRTAPPEREARLIMPAYSCSNISTILLYFRN